MNKLIIKNLSCGYKNKIILSNILFSAKKGNIIAVIGPNGAGKSTLLKTISGIIPSISGNIYLDEKKLNAIKIKEKAKHISIVFPSFNTPFSFSVEDIVKMGRYAYSDFLYDLSLEDKNIIDKWINKCELEFLRKRNYNSLSSGESQRVLLAKALAHEPDILLLDEPLSNMDIHFQIHFMDILKEIKKDYITLIILHDLGLAFRYCDHILILDENKQIFFGNEEKAFNEKLLREIFKIDISCKIINNKKYILI